MDLPTFKKAVDSLDDHPGMIGIIGGEPLLWPHIEVASEYLLQKTKDSPQQNPPCQPINDLPGFLSRHYGDIHKRRGLWTSLPPNSILHWEQLLDTYQFLCVNTHENAGLHQQFLVASGELPLPSQQRAAMIQDCWVNKYWSCSITPQGCWPCEIMGSLAHAFEGPGPTQGWPIEKGWWKRQPEDWGDMLKWCDICGAAMDVPRLRSTDKTEIVSAANYDRLVKIGSRKLAQGNVRIFDTAHYDCSVYQTDKYIDWYLPTTNNQADISARMKPTNNNLKPKKIECVVLCTEAHILTDNWLSGIKSLMDNVVIVSSATNIDNSEAATKHGVSFLVSSGLLINDVLSLSICKDWLLIVEGGALIPHNFKKMFNSHIWNPGTLYRANVLVEDNCSRSEKRKLALFQFFNLEAHFLRETRADDWSFFSSDFTIDNPLSLLWPANKQCLLDF
jgi:hypothetical protein